MVTLTINLTAPEVHPPQRIILFTDNNKQVAILNGLAPDDNGEFRYHSSIATWMEGGLGTLFLDETLNYPGTACWYLGWAFADIAREASRLTEDAGMDNAQEEYFDYLDRIVDSE